MAVAVAVAVKVVVVAVVVVAVVVVVLVGVLLLVVCSVTVVVGVALTREAMVDVEGWVFGEGLEMLSISMITGVVSMMDCSPCFNLCNSTNSFTSSSESQRPCMQPSWSEPEESLSLSGILHTWVRVVLAGAFHASVHKKNTYTRHAPHTNTQDKHTHHDVQSIGENSKKL